MARILVGTDYSTTFNTPRDPQKHTIIRSVIPGTLRRIWPPLVHVGLWNPLGAFDLVHTFNKVPLLTTKPWIISFESSLPQVLGGGAEGVLRRMMRESLQSPKCRAIIAVSNYAFRRAEDSMRDYADWPRIRERIQIIHPAIKLRSGSEHRTWQGEPLRVVFVGNEFARKGGVVTLRLARLAYERRLPVHFEIVSSMRYAEGIYTDFHDPKAYAPDIQLLSLPNVTFHGKIPNEDVLRLLDQSHLLMLPTIHDTYGFGILEGLACGVPVIATATGAIPEVIQDGGNGFLLPMKNDSVGDWEHLRKPPLGWEMLNEVYDALAKHSLDALQSVLDSPGLWDTLSAGAVEQIKRQHNHVKNGALLEEIYSRALAPNAEPG